MTLKNDIILIYGSKLKNLQNCNIKVKKIIKTIKVNLPIISYITTSSKMIQAKLEKALKKKALAIGANSIMEVKFSKDLNTSLNGNAVILKKETLEEFDKKSEILDFEKNNNETKNIGLESIKKREEEKEVLFEQEEYVILGFMALVALTIIVVFLTSTYNQN